MHSFLSITSHYANNSFSDKYGVLKIFLTFMPAFCDSSKQLVPSFRSSSHSLQFSFFASILYLKTLWVGQNPLFQEPYYLWESTQVSAWSQFLVSDLHALWPATASLILRVPLFEVIESGWFWPAAPLRHSHSFHHLAQMCVVLKCSKQRWRKWGQSGLRGIGRRKAFPPWRRRHSDNST